MKRIDTMRMRPEEVRLALARPALHEVEVSKEAAEKTRQVFGEALTPAESVERILSDVEAYGDAAVVDYAERFDGVRLEPAELFLSEEACQAAREACDPAVMEAVREALASIERFHRRQLRRDWFSAEQDGSWVGQRFLPLERVACYVPGGRFPLVSTALMTLVPARLAGVEEIIMCTPCDREGRVNPYLTAAALEAGAHRILRVGGPHAIAALAVGTVHVPKVDKIVGPGNLYVQLAKRAVFGRVGVDGLPGPSEIVIVADEPARPDWIAADLLSQAEHDVEAAAILITPSRPLADRVEEALARRLEALPEPDVARRSLERWGRIVCCRDLAEAAEWVNHIAPEHVELHVPDPWALLPAIRHAGAVFLGDQATEPLGDYVAGPSHVLPTNGTARFASVLGVDDFLRRSSLIAYTPAGARRAGPAAVQLARLEGLEAHARAVESRLAEGPAQPDGEGEAAGLDQ